MTKIATMALKSQTQKYKLKTCYLQWQDEYQQKELVSPILHRTTAIEYECLFLETNQYCSK